MDSRPCLHYSAAEPINGIRFSVRLLIVGGQGYRLPSHVFHRVNFQFILVGQNFTENRAVHFVYEIPSYRQPACRPPLCNFERGVRPRAFSQSFGQVWLLGNFFTHEQWYFRLWSKYMLWLSFSGRRFSNDVELLAFDHFWVTFGRIFTTHAQKQQYQLSVVIFWHYHWVQRLQFIAR